MNAAFQSRFYSQCAHAWTSVDHFHLQCHTLHSCCCANQDSTVKNMMQQYVWISEAEWHWSFYINTGRLIGLLWFAFVECGWFDFKNFEIILLWLWNRFSTMIWPKYWSHDTLDSQLILCWILLIQLNVLFTVKCSNVIRVGTGSV